MQEGEDLRRVRRRGSRRGEDEGLRGCCGGGAVVTPRQEVWDRGLRAWLLGRVAEGCWDCCCWEGVVDFWPEEVGEVRLLLAARWCW